MIRLLRGALSASSRNQNDAVEAVLKTLTNPQTLETLSTFFQSPDVPIEYTHDFIDQVLKRVRFSHSNPLHALHFFNYFSADPNFFHSPFSVDTMLYVLARSRKFEAMWEVLSETKRKDRSLITPRTVDIVLGRVAKVCSVRETVAVFKEFRKMVVEFDTPYYNALFRALCREKSMSDGRNVYHALKFEFRPDVQTYNILLSGWKACEDAEAFFEEMKGMGIEPDIVSYNSMVYVYCQGKELRKAYDVVKAMGKKDIDPDLVTYTTLIGGLGLAGQPDKARGILKEMNEYGCYPDVAAYNAAIRNYCIAKRIGDAKDLLEEMVRKGLSRPNPTTYNLFFRSFYWSNDLKKAWGLYQRMMITECLPNTQSCVLLIRMIKRQEYVDMALELWNDMVHKGFGSFILVSDVLLPMLCDLGKLDEAEKCVLQMLSKGQKPSMVSFKRIKVLMELTNRHEALENLSGKMAGFGFTCPGYTKIKNDDYHLETLTPEIRVV